MRMLNNPNTAPLTETPARFSTVVGKPATISLKYGSGRLFPSKRPGLPDQMMYSLSDGRVAWFSIDVARLIDELHLAPGEPFTICNLGARRGWDVRRAVAEPAANPQRPAHFEAADAIPPFAPEPTALAPQAAAPTVVAVAPATKLEHALKTAIQAASNAERFSHEIGYPVRFDAEAIKAMAITLVINGSEARR
jgi:hypothetical protein